MRIRFGGTRNEPLRIELLHLRIAHWRGRRVELYLPHALAALVDRVRGDVPLATWIRDALARAVRRHRAE